MFNTIKKYYINGLWTELQVRLALKRGRITQEEFEEIINSKKGASTDANN